MVEDEGEVLNGPPSLNVLRENKAKFKIGFDPSQGSIMKHEDIYDVNPDTFILPISLIKHWGGGQKGYEILTKPKGGVILVKDKRIGQHKPLNNCGPHGSCGQTLSFTSCSTFPVLSATITAKHLANKEKYISNRSQHLWTIPQ
ncbi:unnamed protein product [Sphenostylis stenocarpa]|uniref:Uncharacterized protein n=1 Tax=Sphenostylis stenocarpa TaxID=92480 RepID=A0AA86SYY0_9FABA|nr:unnamed protein product [Sphenostylis stenocarpa]